MTGKHRSGSARRHLVVVLLRVWLGQGHQARHRVASATQVPAPAVVRGAHPSAAGPALDPSSRQSVAPRLSVVRTPTSSDVAVDAVLTNAILADVLSDTLPHPVVTLLPLRHRDDAVYAAVEAERDARVTAELAAGAGVRVHRPRHTA